MVTQDNFEVRQALEEVPSEALAATTDLMTSFSQPLSRRWLLRGAVEGATGAALPGASALTALAVHAEATSVGTTLTEFFSILATGEELFVTFYSNAIKNHVQLGVFGSALNALEAIRAEEQMHLNFALSQGGVPATSQFSMPHGQQTFQDRSLFLQTQQLAEELTSGALLAWIKDTAFMGLPRLAELGGQLMQVEGGHRVVGRAIMGADPIPNWGFAPVVLEHFTDVPAAIKHAGFLSPGPGNRFDFHAVSPSFPAAINTSPLNTSQRRGALLMTSSLTCCPFPLGTYFLDNNPSIANLLFGNDAAYPITSGTAAGNLAIGLHALHSLTTGINNTAIGWDSQFANVSGNNNTSLGEDALKYVTGSANTAIGYTAGYSINSGHHNTSMAPNSLYNVTTGAYNVTIGHNAGFGLQTNSTGNVLIGYGTFNSTATANYNTAVGYAAGYYATGSNNVFLGYQAGLNEAGSNKLYIDNQGAGPSGALIYGVFSSTVANQTLTVNATFNTSSVAILSPGYTVATLPAASTALKGARAYVTDAASPSWLRTLTGGGSVVCPVFCNGTAWVAG